MIITLLAFVLTLGVLIVVHEYGHYRVARACGVKVLRFSIGFGRVVWRRQASPDATEFVVSALPFGGYVRMLDEREAPVDASERHLAFNRKPLYQRALVVAAGPAANLLLAIFLYACVHWIGLEEPAAILAAPASESLAAEAGVRAGDHAVEAALGVGEWHAVRSMSDLRWDVTEATLRSQPMRLRVAGSDGATRTVALPLDRLGGREVDAKLLTRIGLGRAYSPAVLGALTVGGPAASAGLRSGDKVLSIAGRAVLDAADLRERIRANGATGEPAEQVWQVERAGRIVEIPVRPMTVEEGGMRLGRVQAQIGEPPRMVTVRYGPVEGLSQAVGKTWDMSVLTLRMLGRMVVGQASLKNLSGPLTIADYAGQSARLGIAYYLGFLAIVSISLGVLNLLPLPMLDGGHLMYYLFEAVTGRPVSPVWLERLQRGGVAIMLMMMSLALYNDLARLLGQQ